MNYKILIKAMGFMFMPTLAVLVVLLVGFFDPIAMWEFIKSDNGWAVTTRVVLLLAEITLVAIMYDNYMEEEKKIIKQNLLNGIAKQQAGGVTRDRADYDERIYRFFPDMSSNWYFKGHTSEDENIIVIERYKKQ